MKLSGVITIDRIDARAKGQGDRGTICIYHTGTSFFIASGYDLSEDRRHLMDNDESMTDDDQALWSIKIRCKIDQCS